MCTQLCQKNTHFVVVKREFNPQFVYHNSLCYSIEDKQCFWKGFYWEAKIIDDVFSGDYNIVITNITRGCMNLKCQNNSSLHLAPCRWLLGLITFATRCLIYSRPPTPRVPFYIMWVKLSVTEYSAEAALLPLATIEYLCESQISSWCLMWSLELSIPCNGFGVLALFSEWRTFASRLQ